ncbi:hypothetical protein L198_02696 [Cryptococcus wingfieldii CBS 7118]|uniref:Uncharacterized protein n=1 Tax=Cryptococcus wingfieldii CBS 7118 TaxID=1295528 RepID=A0A1E3JM75_9TREE|nr:hypothetical protein L198_02696 [Cryptococcus wingfieldii CBS 7118]ODO01965.1 hypothetical protein L198_02696 [Cryptococcus wingfieldii CBS 7118]
MPDEKKPWLGKDTFPTIWIWICFIFNVFGILAFIMLIVAEFVVLVNDFSNYHAQYGYHYDPRGYTGEEGCGYVDYTNAPKHLGSAVWMLLYQLSIIILCTLVLASDLAWRASSYNAWGGRWISVFYAGGVTNGPRNDAGGLYFYVAANAWFKAFIVVLYMNQSFYGMRGNTSHESPYSGSSLSDSGSSSGGYYSASASASASSNSGFGSSGSSASSSSSTPAYSWKRSSDPNKIHGVEAWVYLSGWIVLCSIVPSMVAFLFLAPWGKKKEQNGAGGEAA